MPSNAWSNQTRRLVVSFNARYIQKPFQPRLCARTIDIVVPKASQLLAAFLNHVVEELYVLEQLLVLKGIELVESPDVSRADKLN